jgi:hypothetical protein
MSSTLWPLNLFYQISLFYCLKQKHISVAGLQIKIMTEEHEQRLVEMTASVSGNIVLTHDSQSDRVTCALSLGVGGEASVVTRCVACDAL